MTRDKTQNVKGLIIVGDDGDVILQLGVGQDRRLISMVSDPDWMTEAMERRIVPALLTDAQYVVLVTPVQDGRLVLFFDAVTDTVLRFFTQVDFAFDIIDHILNDPYDAMAVIDAKARLVFVSPVHEKFFGLKTGEGVGRNVRDVIQNTRLHHVVRTGVAEVGQIQRMRDSERVVSRHPIKHDGMVMGAIGRVMFKGPQQVEALARRINVLEKEIASYRTERKASEHAEAFLKAIVGQSPAIEAVRDQIRKVAPLDIPVLVQGESGTGKELVAKALHALSPRSKGRLITVNAAALPASLVESELFGYEPGSFTGADSKGRLGKFEQADRGTIFLDEIGDMPLEVQSKLLRVLQDKIVERVGGENPRQVDFRLISATNRDLERFIEQEKFRLDLFYRISPVIIRMPTLAERIEDIPLLLDHFLTELSAHYDRPMPEVEDAVPDLMMGRAWPGNVRELHHVIERAFVFAENGWLRVVDFEQAGLAAPPRRIATASAAAPDLADGGSLKDVLGQLEHKLIADAMIRFNGNKKKVAEHLGISRSYLYKKLEEDFEA
ncbi:sigma-54 interaction domain-containing protein [Roseovarius amoyensis]|uniref:sigma-54 interaction domain-containing protein n=1 Tax=Roseovarius amoyensis TaxID=2211448 RepID=UPI000DBE7632|nr:sigma 54-interacting transcriptional regulator [Roseovarius amoyensis]